MKTISMASIVLLITSLTGLAVPSFGQARPGEVIKIPGARSIDHVGLTVPDLEQAIRFFEDVLGAAVLWTSAPFTPDGRGPLAPAGLNADPKAAVRLAMMRLGLNINVELIEYRIPGAQKAMPLSSELAVGHIAFDVDDIARAGRYLRSKGVEMLEGPRRNTQGPNAGQDSWFFVSPWGMALELISRPSSMPYERDTAARLFKADVQNLQRSANADIASASNDEGASMKSTQNLIHTLENQRVKALVDRDFEALGRLMAADCIFVESNGATFMKTDFIENARESKNVFESFIIDQNEVRIFGAVAVVTGRYQTVVLDEKKVKTVKQARHTRVWVKQSDTQWLLVSHQATQITP